MKLFKKLGTYFSMLSLLLTGTSFKSIASEGEEGSEAFDDPNKNTEEEDSSGESQEAAESSSSGASGAGAGVWVAITGAVLAVFSGGSSEFITPSGGPPVVPPTPTWGNMLSLAFQSMRGAPYLTFAPGIAIVLLVMAFSFVGDGLRDALDPKTTDN